MVPAASGDVASSPTAVASKPASGGARPAAAAEALFASCPSCAKKLKLPAGAAGKKVACPGCKAAFVVPAAAPAGAKNAASRPAVQAGQPSARAAVSAPRRPVATAAAGSSGAATTASSNFFDELVSEDDLTRLPMAPNASRADSAAVGGGSKRRPAAFYYVPGLLAVIAGAINIVVFLSLTGFIVYGLVSELGKAAIVAAPFLIRIGIWAFFNISANAHAIVGGLNVMRRTAKSSASVTCGELMLAPFFLDSIFIWEAIANEERVDNPWILPIVLGVVFAAYNWPPAIWLMSILNSEQAKVDFEDYDDDDLDEMANQLVSKSSGGH
ncbi:hypothetical protein NHH03_21255 [Stieleria sp. TO1_6]|uniref:hypothetical protein n=1 Tax=Stieleria tagensis TaxID=2956795 RepID=UPI00209B72F3|nr:hypothetical protein [Stieleria tagensis]MCO8124284.1 hypothetical protein [Stieleria tagensis]